MKRAAQMAVVCGAMLAASAGQVQAETLTISGTGQFDPSLGTLNSVTVTFNPPAVNTNTLVHGHLVDPLRFAVGLADGTWVDFSDITLSVVGSHAHTLDLPTFLWNGFAINPPTLTNSTPSGLHNHTVNFLPAEVQSGFLELASTQTSAAQHSHVIDVGAFNATFSGSDLDVFLNGSPTAAVSIPSFNSSFEIGHRHDLIPGFYNAFVIGVGGIGNQPIYIPSASFSSGAGGHSYAVSIPSFGVTSTTFNFTVSAVPEPSSIAMFGLGACVLGFGAARRHWRENNA